MFAQPKLCLACGHQGKPRRIMKGSIGVELLLWLFFLLPGLVYSLWRHISVYDGCSSCGDPSLIPLDSPRAQEILRNRG